MAQEASLRVVDIDIHKEKGSSDGNPLNPKILELRTLNDSLHCHNLELRIHNYEFYSSQKKKQPCPLVEHAIKRTSR